MSYNIQHKQLVFNGIIFLNRQRKLYTKSHFAFCKSLWQNIDWNGNFRKNTPNNPPSVDELKSSFEDLYASDSDEKYYINQLQSNISIPSLDEPIIEKEIDDARKKMKKGGFDYTINILQLLILNIKPQLIMLLNMIFYLCYPVNMSLNIFSAIPKKRKPLTTK